MLAGRPLATDDLTRRRSSVPPGSACSSGSRVRRPRLDRDRPGTDRDPPLRGRVRPGRRAGVAAARGEHRPLPGVRAARHGLHGRGDGRGHRRRRLPRVPGHLRRHPEDRDAQDVNYEQLVVQQPDLVLGTAVPGLPDDLDARLSAVAPTLLFPAASEPGTWQERAVRDRERAAGALAHQVTGSARTPWAGENCRNSTSPGGREPGVSRGLVALRRRGGRVRGRSRCRRRRPRPAPQPAGADGSSELGLVLSNICSNRR